MPVSLSKANRSFLESTTLKARLRSESACQAALENLAVHEKDFRSHMTVEQQQLRNRLRARGRALGDKRDERSRSQEIRHLCELAAYEHWHRLLFTRFLTENHLLITDRENGNVPVTLEECEELAAELGARDGLDLACRFASLTLPGVFRRDDPVLELPLAINDQIELRKLLASLPTECFLADDGLGWTYQFWQAKRKKDVNESGKKIGADELSPVTQLFTDDYMVEFLIHNTLGAWWAARLGPIKAVSEEEARSRISLAARQGVPAISWRYLRFAPDSTGESWLPSAGLFEEWPKSGRELRLLDPCMGSGHFLVFALTIMMRIRMEEEQLDPKAAAAAVIEDNIYGLELDLRCTQIAAFNLALTAWKVAGYQTLPNFHVACSGIAPSAAEAEWKTYAGTDDRLRRGMMRLYNLFKEAPVLGSLINPRGMEETLIEADFHELESVLTVAVSRDSNGNTSVVDDSIELGVTAQGLSKAAELLSSHFTLVITNVPYLGHGNQGDTLKEYCERFYPEAKSDLASCFLQRCRAFCGRGTSMAVVTPQNWLFQPRYEEMRKDLLGNTELNCVAKLGPRAFEAISGEIVNVALVICSVRTPSVTHSIAGLDVSSSASSLEKSKDLREESLTSTPQKDQLNTPGSRITLTSYHQVRRLDEIASAFHGQAVGDNESYNRMFWEVVSLGEGWEPYQSQPDATSLFSGRQGAIHWENESGRMAKLADSVRHLNHKAQQWRSGKPNWGKTGVAVSLVGKIYATLYSGEIYAQSCCVIVPHDDTALVALWCFASSGELELSLRRIDSSLGVSVKTVISVPFDLPHWLDVAEKQFPDGLPKAYSADPTQWIFDGHPKAAQQPLHVAVARLMGYRWPRQNGSSFLDCPALGADGLEAYVDDDGIVCLPALNREQPAAARLRRLLVAAFGTFDERLLVASAGPKGSKSKTLEDWLRDEFFEQHTKLFAERPFIWHLWDGRADGFHALVNYHLLNHANLQKLTYSYLGDWIQQQAEDAKDQKPGAAVRLGAAKSLQQKLAAILVGEAPLDIFVRWKPIVEQVQGWNPDLNDGVRQNIRPFLLAGDVGKRGAGLFRNIPLSLKEKDRGSEPNGSQNEYPWFWCQEAPGTDPPGGPEFVGTRWNNAHLTLAKKQRSRP